jgi:exodeoxyribonuclease VII large subunit
VDLIIIARGGGSLEDLWAFNDEDLARAIAACPLPIISAVGHETDFTIADFVADVRAPTPSAAAELAVPVLADLLGDLRTFEGRLSRGLLAEIQKRRLYLERAQSHFASPRALIDDRRQTMDDLADRAGRAITTSIKRQRTNLQLVEIRVMQAHPRRRIADQRASLTALDRRLGTLGNQLLAHRRRILDTLASKLTALSPLGVLERGYCLARDPNGQLVKSIDGLAKGDPLKVTFRSGDLHTTIESVVPSRPTQGD